MNEHDHDSTPESSGQPNPSPGAQPHGGWRPAPGQPLYTPPPRPPRKKSRALWKILFGFVGVLFFIFVGLSVLGFFLFGGRSEGGAGIGFGDTIGLVRIEGIIHQGDIKEFWMDTLRELNRNERIRGIVVRIDSPGGTVGASQELYSQLAGSSKPVYVSMGDTAASGGYYIASAADRIYAVKGTITGSIGVIFSKPQVQELARRLGIETETVVSGEFKDSGSMTRPMTDDERYIFRLVIDDTHRQFVNDIHLHRARQLAQACSRLPPEKWGIYGFEQPVECSGLELLNQLADGRVYTGAQAHELGLVDQIGTLDDAIMALSERVGIEGRPRIYEPEPHRSLLELLQVKMNTFMNVSGSPIQYLMHY